LFRKHTNGACFPFRHEIAVDIEGGLTLEDVYSSIYLYFENIPLDKRIPPRQSYELEKPITDGKLKGFKFAAA